MKYDIPVTAVNILEHIIFIAEKTSKQIQFCFTKGNKQYYLTPKRNIFITFKLKKPIQFDYPIPDLKKFLQRNKSSIDSNNLLTNKDDLFLPTINDIKEFENKKLVQIMPFSHNDLRLLSSTKTKKYEFINIMSENNLSFYRFQKHIWDWWRNEDKKLIIKKGKVSRKFRYIMNRNLLSRMLPNDYKLFCRRGVLQFQLKHLNYYFESINEFHGQGVRKFYSPSNSIKDKDLLKRYKKARLIPYPSENTLNTKIKQN